MPERIDARGEVLVPLDEAAVEALVPRLEAAKVESIAVGYLHSFVNGDHERRTRDILARRLPGVAITLSSEVSPEMREFERFSTACANAYVQPLMARYLAELERRRRDGGLAGPLFLMLSGGGITTLETAIRYPVRLVESGPAGGAIFASHIAAQSGLDSVLSFDRLRESAFSGLASRALTPATSSSMESRIAPGIVFVSRMVSYSTTRAAGGSMAPS